MELGGDEHPKLSCARVVEVGYPVHKIHPEYFKNIFNAIAQLDIGFPILKKAHGQSGLARRGKPGDQILVGLSHPAKNHIEVASRRHFNLFINGILFNKNPSK